MNVFTSENAFQKLFTSLDTDWSGVVECEEFVKLGQEAAVSHTVVEFIPLEEVAAVEFDLVHTTYHRPSKCQRALYLNRGASPGPNRKTA